MQGINAVQSKAVLVKKDSILTKVEENDTINIFKGHDRIENVSQAISQTSNKLYQKLYHWGDIILGNIPNIILAVIVLVLGVKLLKFVQKSTKSVVGRVSENNISVVNLVVNIVTILYYALLLFLVLSIFDLDGTINKILATAGVVGLAVGLALQEPLTNLFSGIQMSIQHPYSIGDIVESNGHFGIIKKISLSNTEITLFSGENVIIPNKKVIQQSLTNFSLNKLHRINITVGVEYSTDLEVTKTVITEAIKKVDGVILNKPIEVYYTDFGDSSINMQVMFWHLMRSHYDLLRTKSDAIIAIKKSLDEESINIPFPITTLNIPK